VPRHLLLALVLLLLLLLLPLLPLPSRRWYMLVIAVAWLSSKQVGCHAFALSVALLLGAVVLS
jgi:Na+/H+ antiporter NhaA